MGAKVLNGSFWRGPQYPLIGRAADPTQLGAAIGAPLANAALLCGAFWGQGHDDARSVLWLNYCLLAAFATPAALQFPRHAALARAFEHERAAGLVVPFRKPELGTPCLIISHNELHAFLVLVWKAVHHRRRE